MDGLMNKELNGMPFSEIMNQAVKLKTHQVLFYKHSEVYLCHGKNLVIIALESQAPS
jgi:hypothetical protein